MPPNSPGMSPSYYSQPSRPPKMPGRSNKLLLGLIGVIVLLCVSSYFGFWAYTGRQDYKNNVDSKVSQAVQKAIQTEDAKKDSQLAQALKNPFRTYQGPATYGSLLVQYPNTWSAFVTEDDQANNPIDGYFHPNVVPGIQSGTAFALRVIVTNQPYDQLLKQYTSQAQTGKISISPYRAPKVQAILGSRLVGQFEDNQTQQEDLILLPLRDKTIELSTRSNQYEDDFNNIVLANFSFSP